jgi:hypothetical protein
MREIRQSGSEGGVAHPRHPYPYFSAVSSRLKTFLLVSRELLGGLEWKSVLLVLIMRTRWNGSLPFGVWDPEFISEGWGRRSGVAIRPFWRGGRGFR